VINLVLASLFNLRRHLTAPRRIFVLIDAEAGVGATEYLRCLRPWAAAASILGAVEADPSTIASLAGAPALGPAELVVIVSGNSRLLEAVREACTGAGRMCVDCSLPPEGSRELALFQEVLHHDIELGGHNDWTGGDSQFGAAVLQTLSAVHCRRRFPGYIERHLRGLQPAGQRIRALDVGCGAVSRLRWGALNDLMTVTGIDPLLDMYAIVRERHGLSGLPAIRCAHEVRVGAEDMGTALVPASVDFVYCANALDHTEDPVVVMRAIAQVLRPGGLLAIEVFTREGTREGWWQLHQFDMYMDERKRFVCEARDGVVRHLLPEDGGFVVRECVSSTAAMTILVAERLAAGSTAPV